MNQRIIDYIIIKTDSTQVLAKQVRDNIGVGWQPIGGVNHIYQGIAGSMFIQAMVKYEFIPQSYTVETEIDIPY